MSNDAQEFHAPSLTVAEQHRFLMLERELVRRDKRSKNRERTKLKLAALRRKLLDRRVDWMEQSTTELARTYQCAAVEKLNINGMVKKPAPKPDPDVHGAFLPNGAAAKSVLSRSIHASQWGKFVKRLVDKMEVVQVPAAYTSLRCFECKHVSNENRKSQAVFCCVKCGHEANADVNAAKNILYEALCGRTCRVRAEAAPAVDAKTPLTENPRP
jgi:transposase